MNRILMAAALALAGCGNAIPSLPAPAPDQPYVVKSAPGGNIMDHVALRGDLKRSGVPVQIMGRCASSCTILYSLPNACLGPDAVLGFHGASSPIGISEAISNRQLASYYRAGIKAGFLNGWSKITGTKWADLHHLTRDQAIALDPKIKKCEAMK